MNVVHTVDIPAPIERVFNCVSNPRSHTAWAADLETVSMQQPYDPNAPVGTRFTQHVREGGRRVKYDGEIVAYERPQRFAVRVGRPHLSLETEYRLSPLDESRTRLTMSTTVVERPWYGALIAPLTSRMTARALRQQAEGLRALAARGGCPGADEG